MKTTQLFSIVLTTLLFSITQLLAQSNNWGEIGTKWVYSINSMDSRPYNVYEVERDTVINDKAALIISVTRVLYYGLGTLIRAEDELLPEMAILRESNDSIFYYQDEEFKYMYSLTLEVGDEWALANNSDYDWCPLALSAVGSQSVSDIETVIVDERELLRASIDSEGWQLGSYIYPLIGSSGSLLPLPLECTDAIDGFSNQPKSLRCFYSPSIGDIKVHPNEEYCFDILFEQVGLEYLDNRNDLVYPNPFENEFFVSTRFDAQDLQVQLISLSGQIFNPNFSIAEELIHIEGINGLAEGVYILTVGSSTGSEFYKVTKLQ